MIHRRCIYPLILLLSLIAAAPQAHGEPPTVRVGIVTDGYWERNDEVRELFQKEILELTRGEFDVRFPPEKDIEADWTVEGVRTALDRLLADREVDVVLALGIMASDDVCQRRDLSKPVLAPFVIDAEIQGLPLEGDVSGVENLSYVFFPASIQSDIEAFLQVVPFTRLTVLVNQRYQEAIPELADRTQKMVQALGVDPKIVPIDKSVDEVFAGLPPGIEAVYVTPLIHLPPGDFDRLVGGLIERRLPSFSLMGRSEVERGILASLKPDIFPRLARRVALNLQRILLGEDAGSIPVVFAPGEQLTINMATARAIGVSPSWAVVTEAELIQQAREDISRSLDIYTAVQEALAANLELSAKDRFVSAQAQNITSARANLLPQVALAGVGVVIDEDRAAGSMGQQPERTVSGSVSATQVLYSEAAWANLSIQKKLQRGREEERRQLRLDIMQASATAYLNVLRTKTFERIQGENLRRTRSNLELARVREVVGSAGPAEVYRWESLIASNRKTVIEANAGRNLAEMDLNRLLHRPLEESFLTEEPRLDVSAGGTYHKYLGDKRTFRLFRAFLVQEGLSASPELTQLDAMIASQERGLRSANRGFWIPIFAARGELSHTFSREGAGVEPLPMDDTNWSLALSASLPLFEGGSKLAARRKALETLAQLRLERRTVEERIEQRVRSAAHTVGASYAGIGQMLEAAEAADKSLDVVRDAYSRGVVSVVDLLDAQNAVLLSDLGAADAFYTFLIDLVAVGRAIGQLSFTEEEQDAFFGRADQYLKQQDTDSGHGYTD